MGKDILVIAEIKEGEAKKVTLEILSAGRKLADKMGGNLSALVLGTGLSGFGAKFGPYGADTVLLADDQCLAAYSNEAYCQTIADLRKKIEPDVVLFGATVQGKDLAPRVAAALDTGLASDCVDVSIDDGGLVTARRPVFAGKAFVDIVFPEARPQIISMRPNVLPVSEPQEGKTAEESQVELNIGDVKGLLKEVVAGAGGKRADLTEADIIVSGGRGMKDKENFNILEDLADVIGATVGASRAAVDSGYAEQSMQVGQTGKVVNPSLYIAAGISGAIQHLAGMRTSKYIVAINKDPDAPIFQKADYGIVGDLFKAVPLLTEELKKIVSS